ncbi:MAG: hypothetical protein IPL32_13910 [Chloracidobacterium sp.]|nr:hypothetical protein [Chloracidobacterium sp.]
MKFKFAAVILGMVMVSSSAFAQAKIDVASVKWLTGCWEMRNEPKGTVTSEQWTSSEGGALFGIGRTVKKGKLVSWEFMRIVQENDSAKFFAQLPNAAQATPFALKSANVGEMVFENLQNDFPHRVIYRNAGVNKLAARIEGKINEKDKGIDFAFVRSKCE